MGGGEDGKSPLLVPKGQMVQWSLYCMHRRKDYYGEDAEEFKPERWDALRPGWVGFFLFSSLILLVIRFLPSHLFSMKLKPYTPCTIPRYTMPQSPIFPLLPLFPFPLSHPLPPPSSLYPTQNLTSFPQQEYLPFNGGPRICLGQQFALTEASYTTIRLMQEFSAIESRDDRPWRENLTLTCAIHQGVIVGLVGR